MRPIELQEQALKLPATDDHSIVLVTGQDLRHKRFAYRLQQEFGDLVVAWFELDYNTQFAEKKNEQPANTFKRIFSFYKSEGTFNFKKDGIVRSFRRIYGLTKRKLKERIIHHQYNKCAPENEKELFEKDINRIKQFAKLKPITIHPSKINSEEFIEQIKQIKPYFFLTLGGQLYKKPLLSTIRGVAINQHAGHSPDLKGAFTIEWALYKRDLSKVSNTVHITTTGADAGPILRRSQPCIFPTDNIHTIFARSVALGTELMIESVKEIISNKNIIAYKQPKKSGRTYLYKEFTPDIKKSLARDFKTSWLSDELEKMRNY